MRVGLVLEGGAMRGIYTAGVIDTLMKENILVDGIIGVSAGALFGMNYKSKQIGRVKRYNENYIKDNVSGATVKSLIQLVKTNNAVEDSSKTITLNYETGLNESGINSVEKYDVSVKNASGNDGYVNGVIKNILIKKHVEKKSGE